MQVPVNTVITEDQLDASLAELEKASIIALDTETDGLNWHQNKVVGVSWATHKNAWYMPVAHAGKNASPAMLQQLGEALEGAPLVGHNLKFDQLFLHKHPGWEWIVGHECHDSQIAAYCLDENQWLKLESVASKYLGYECGEEEARLMLKIAEKLGKKRAAKADKARMCLLEGHEVAPYACADAFNSLRILDRLLPLLKADKTLQTYHNLRKYQVALTAMEANGLPVLPAIMHQNWREAEEVRDTLAKEIVELSEGAVKNPGSHKQLRDWLDLISTSKQALEDFIDGAESDDESEEDSEDESKVEAAKKILSYRKWAKAVSTYYKTIAENVGEGTTLFPTLRLTGAAVRLSASNPNTQAIPRGGSEQYKIKDFIGFEDDSPYFILEADLSQAEIVMGAHLTNDPTLLKVVTEGFDMHTGMKDQVKEDFNLEITRQQGKTLNFALQYGAGAAKMAKQMKVPVKDAEKMVKAHHNLYPGLRQAYVGAQKMMRQKKYVQLWSGRKRHWSKDFKDHSALNALIQGGVSELMRVAIVRLYETVPELKLGLTVHDSVIGVIHEKDLTEDVFARIRKAMTDFPWLKVPIKTDIEVGKTWAVKRKV